MINNTESSHHSHSSHSSHPSESHHSSHHHHDTSNRTGDENSYAAHRSRRDARENTEESSLPHTSEDVSSIIEENNKELSNLLLQAYCHRLALETGGGHSSSSSSSIDTDFTNKSPEDIKNILISLNDKWMSANKANSSSSTDTENQSSQSSLPSEEEQIRILLERSQKEQEEREQEEERKYLSQIQSRYSSDAGSEQNRSLIVPPSASAVNDDEVNDIGLATKQSLEDEENKIADEYLQMQLKELENQSEQNNNESKSNIPKDDLSIPDFADSDFDAELNQAIQLSMRDSADNSSSSSSSTHPVSSQASHSSISENSVDPELQRAIEESTAERKKKEDDDIMTAQLLSLADTLAPLLSNMKHAS